jgi:DNA repair ATPase RecN
MPDSPEGRERIGRIEERVENNRRQIDTLAPLVRDVGRLQWGLDELASDLKQFRLDVREQRTTDKQDRAAELEELRRGVSSQILVVTDGLKGCSDKIGALSDMHRKHHADEMQRRADESKATREAGTQDLLSRRALYGILAASAIGAIGVILTPIINALLG